MMHNWQPTARLDAVLDRSIDRLDHEDPESILRDYPQSRQTLAPMLHIADALRDLQQVTMPSSAKQAGRERLHKAVLARRRPRSALAHSMRMVAWAAAFVLVCTGAIGGLNRAATNTLPDQPLYAWKRASERVWLGVQFTPEREIAVSLALADRRVDEVKRLYQRSGRVYPTMINQLHAEYKRTLQLINTLPPAKAQPLLAQAQTIGAQHEQQLLQLAQLATGNEQQILLAAVQVSQWVQDTPPAEAAAAPTPIIPDRASAIPTNEPAVPGKTIDPSSPPGPPASEQPPVNPPSEPPGEPSIGLPTMPEPTAGPVPPAQQPSTILVPPAQKPSTVPQPSRPARPAPTERASVPRPTATPEPTQAPPPAPLPTDTPAQPGPSDNPTVQPGPTIEPPVPPTIAPEPPSNPPDKPTNEPGPPRKPTNEPGPPSNPPGNPTVQPGPPSNPPGNPTIQPGPPGNPPGHTDALKPTVQPQQDEAPPKQAEPPKTQP